MSESTEDFLKRITALYRLSGWADGERLLSLARRGAETHWRATEEAPYGLLVLTYWPGNPLRNPVITVNERNSGADLGVRGSWWHSKPGETPTHFIPLTSLGEPSDG